MHRDNRLMASALLLPAALVWAAVASTGAGAAFPAQQTTPTQPMILDPLHHISGVIAVPPETMMRPSDGPAEKLIGPLTPPIFGPNVDATNNDANNQNETTIAIDPENDQHVIASANDYRGGLKPYVYHSTDGGATWTNYIVPGTSGLYYGDPAMAFDRGGRAYFSYLGYQGVCAGVGGMYVSRSTDAGAGFSSPHQLASNSNDGQVAVLQDKEYVAVDSNPASPFYGNAYVGWTKFSFHTGANCGDPESQITAPGVVSRSTDQGVTWSVPITATPPFSDNVQGMVPVVGRHGEVYLYYVGAQTQAQHNYDTILFSRSTDGGQSFSHFTHIASIVDLPSPLPPTSFRVDAFGALAADQQIDGYLYAVWADYRTGDADILLSRSTDNGDTWGPPVRLNDDSVGNGKDQFFPWIAAAPDGRIHVAWFDRREDPNNRNYKEYYTSSTDHGATWEANIAVSTAPSVPGSSTFIGDYSGIAASSGVVIPVWTDIRTGSNQNAYVARGVYTVGPQETPTAGPSSTPTGTSTPTDTATPVPPSETPTEMATITPVPPTPCAITFSDVPPENTFYPYVRCLACRGILGGYDDGTFRPNNPITRGQISKIVSNAAGWTDPIPNDRQTYTDVDPNHPFWLWIERATAHGIMSGYNCGGPGEPCDPQNRPYFRPWNNATRAQLAKIDSNAAGYNDDPTTQTFADVDSTHPFYVWIERLATRGIMGGYACGGPGEPCDPQNRPYFRPYNNVTRGQASKIVANTFYPNCQTPAR